VYIAVVIPAYNIAEFLPTAIQSVIDQTHADWSLVVVDDGSIDATAAVGARFQDLRIRRIRQRNSGVSAARNAGIRAALVGHPPGGNSDEWAEGSAFMSWPDLAWPPGILPASAPPASASLVGRATSHPGPGAAGDIPCYPFASVRPEAFLFLDGDDWLAPAALALLAETLAEAPWAAAAVARYARVDLNGAARRSAAPPQGSLLERLLTRNLFANGGHLLIRREAIEATGKFRVDLEYGEDWEYWTRLALQGEFISVPSRSPLLFVRERLGGAYLSRATDPSAYRPALDVIYHNPGLAQRLGIARLAALRQRANAEMAWTVGRELIRHGQNREGSRWLGRSFREAPTLTRLMLIGLSRLRFGPFRPYRAAT
jgi:GT2 family glycosyltransferase